MLMLLRVLEQWNLKTFRHGMGVHQIGLGMKIGGLWQRRHELQRGENNDILILEFQGHTNVLQFQRHCYNLLDP